MLFWQPWKSFSTIVPKTSKIIRKSWSFQDFFSKRLLLRGSSGHVESSFDNPAKNFPVKLQVFLVKVQEKRKTNFSKVFFDVFPSVHLITVSTHLTIFLPKSDKTPLKIPKEMMLV